MQLVQPHLRKFSDDELGVEGQLPFQIGSTKVASK